MPASTEPQGKVLAVRGVVIDVGFDGAELPRLEEALVVDWDRPGTLIVEVQAHLDEHTVRGVALQATAGLRRGVRVRATGEPRHRAGRRRGARPADRRHRRASATTGRRFRRRGALADPSRGAAAGRAQPGDGHLRDRHQGHRPAGAAGAGRQGGDVRRRRRRQDRARHGADPRHGRELRGHLGVRRRRRALARGPRAAARDAAAPACSSAASWSTAR